MYANHSNVVAEPQSQFTSNRQRPAGSERTNPTLDSTVVETAGDNVSHAAPDGSVSNVPENRPNPGENNLRSVPRRHYQHPAVNAVRDDPFFSDELFNGMLNGQPDTNHVGSMYTQSHQRDIDEY